jgi:hypothetical protein
MSKTSAVEDDLLWRNSSLSINPTKSLPSIWLFNDQQSTLSILCQPNPTVLQLPQLTLLFLALLDLHTCYFGCESEGILGIEQHTQLTIYHNCLQSSVEANLLQHANSVHPIAIPDIMMPWIQRTMLCYGHDDRGRKDISLCNFEAYGIPESKLDFSLYNQKSKKNAAHEWFSLLTYLISKAFIRYYSYLLTKMAFMS